MRVTESLGDEYRTPQICLYSSADVPQRFFVLFSYKTKMAYTNPV